ncbi:MAG: hypothetical protein HYY63_06665 [Elusimicrobia bacterium]|nr:hypothetical protein [Elusimicrobiota bacterium]MBI2915921.1 hypothetical protein [Elusimicrobiota bacterium]MBI3013290.1 hypothetical protein [Elusimicrobiota bacterium]MBI4218367.1 hypothetical protein [Elusimicrobiota bacterium]
MTKEETNINKYDLILLARRWVYELKSKEGETRTLQELIGVAVRDITSGAVSAKTIRDLPPLRTFKKQKSSTQDILQALSQVGTKPSEKESSEK